MELWCLVKPKSKSDQIIFTSEGTLRIKIKALPVDGEANEYLVNYLADFFQIRKNCVQIISGFTNSHKRINIVLDEIKIKERLSKL